MSPAHAFHAVSLIATARTALQASRQIGDRRAGLDPSAQEPEGPVREDLADLGAALADLVVRLRLRVVVGSPHGVVGLAQAFEDRLLLDDLGRTLGVVQQKLLSLYPAVEEDLVEHVRQAAAEARARAVSDDPEVGLERFTAEVGDLADTLGDALGAG